MDATNPTYEATAMKGDNEVH